MPNNNYKDINQRYWYFLQAFVSLFCQNRKVKYPKKVLKSQNHEIKYLQNAFFCRSQNLISLNIYLY